jgi:hypothetical protein
VQAGIGDARAGGRAGGGRHGGEYLELHVQAGQAENGGHGGRGGSQPQDAAEQPGAAPGADQHGQPAGIAEGHPGQVDDNPAGMRPQHAEELLAQRWCARDVEVATYLRDGVTVLAADGKRQARKGITVSRGVMFGAHLGSGRTGSSCAQGGADETVSAREAPGLAHSTLCTR